MDLITRYIQEHSNGRSHPISGSSISSALGISGIKVREMVNTARCNGSPICSNGCGYYIAQDKEEVQRTMDSMRGRIAAMTKALNGLESYMRGTSA